MGKKLTHEEFMRKANDRNERIRNGRFEIRGDYVDSETPILCHCNMHNIDWNLKPERIYNSVGCKECVREVKTYSQRQSEEDFLNNVMNKNERVRNGQIEIRGKYCGFHERIECYCKKHNVTWRPIAGSLYKNIGCRECAKEGISEKNSMTHEEYVNGMNVRNEKIKVLTQYIGMDKDITVELSCGHVWTTKAAYVYYRDFQCPYCTSNAILVGFNDLFTTSPETAVLLTNQNEGYSLMKNSARKTNFTCPWCGKVQQKFVRNISRRGWQCAFCGDGISYPNKFGRAFLDQVIGDKYIPEYTTSWCAPYKYDNYFRYNGRDYFLEMDGWFHYREDGMSDISLEERQKIDALKDDLAHEHNIHMIRINCVESNCDYITNNMINSELSVIFDLSKIDWQKCDMRAQKNLVKEACDLYMSGIKSAKEISKIIRVSQGTAIIYLKKGAEFGWCDYDPKQSRNGMSQPKLRKPIIATNTQSGIKYYFDSMTLCETTMVDVCGITISRASILKSIRSGDPCKGFIFQLANLTTQN